MKYSIVRYGVSATLAAIMLILVCCGNHGNVSRRLDAAERVMEEHPDSALAILDAVNTDSLGSKKEKARYALLMSMALDKNYIDTTDFKVLQPAIDYYLKKGTPDEKLKTLYYQGRIFENADSNDSAMMCYLKASDVDGVTDSLAYARLLVAQGWLYSLQCKYDEFIENNLKAAKLNHSYGKIDMELRNYARALIGCLCLEINEKNKIRADSIYQIGQDIINQHPAYSDNISTEILSYITEYGSVEETGKLLDKYQGFDYPDYMKINIAKGYSKIGDGKTALQYLDSVDGQYTQLSGDSIKYHLVRSDAEELEGDYISAIRSYKEGIDKIMNLHGNLLEHGLPFSDEKHKLEIANLEEVQKRSVLK